MTVRNNSSLISCIDSLLTYFFNRKPWMIIALALASMALNQAYADTTKDNEALCFQQAERYEKEANKLANDARDPRKWFDLAMKNYLCAAKAGNSLAMWRAVNLSGSGQVEALPKDTEEKLLFQAAQAGLAEAQIGVGVAYCENVGTSAPCKNRVEAEKWFLRAALSGNANGAFQLGVLYERDPGNKINAKFERAIACYRLSSERIRKALDEKGEKDRNQLKSSLALSEQAIERVSKIMGGRGSNTSCY